MEKVTTRCLHFLVYYINKSCLYRDIVGTVLFITTVLTDLAKFCTYIAEFVQIFNIVNGQKLNNQSSHPVKLFILL